MKPRQISVEVVQIGGGTQMREDIDGAVLTAYAEDIENGDKFPPVDLFHDGETYWLADGFHRFLAFRDSGAKTISAIVHKGTNRDATLFAVGANAAHGLRRTNADKRKAVATLLDDKEWSAWSNRLIAEKCGVSGTMVDGLRNELQKNCSSPPATTGKDGKKRKPPKKRKPKKRKPLPDPDSFPDAEDTTDDETDKTETDGAVSVAAEVALHEINGILYSFSRTKPSDDSRQLLAEGIRHAAEKWLNVDTTARTR